MNKDKFNDTHTKEAYEKVFDHFKGDKKKTNEWFAAPNKDLGQSPLKIIGAKRGDHLNRYVDEKFRGRK